MARKVSKRIHGRWEKERCQRGGRAAESGALADVPGSADRENSGIAAGEEDPFQKAAALIVEEVFVPPVLDQLGYDNDDAARRMLRREIENELDDRNDDETVGRGKDVQFGRLFAGGAIGLDNVTVPVELKEFGLLGGVHVESDHIGRETRSEFNALAGDVAPAIDGDDGDGRVAEAGGVNGNHASGAHFHGVVVAANPDEKCNCKGNEEKGDPGALGEFGDQDNENGDAGYKSAQAVDEGAAKPVWAAISPPVDDHSGLRQSESEESADGVERDEAVGDAAEEDEKSGA